MSSLDSVLTRQALAQGTSVHNKADQPVALRLRYVGTGTVTSVTVVTATSVANITSDGGTDTYLFSAYTTVGALADAINADGVFEAKVLDVLRSKNPDDSLLAAALTSTTTDENDNNVYDLVTDTSGALQVAACLSPARGFDSPEGHRVHLQEVKYFATVNGASADSFQIFKRKGTTERQVYGTESVTGTLTTINFASGNGKLTGRPDEEIIALLKDGTSVSDTGLYLTISGIIE